MSEDTEKILDLITETLFPGYKEQGTGKSDLQFAVWEYLRKHANSSISKIKFKEKFNGKKEISKQFAIRKDESKPVVTNRIYEYIRKNPIKTINEKLLNRKYNSKPFAYYAYISTANQNAAELVTNPNDIINAINSVSAYGRGDDELNKAREKVLSLLERQHTPVIDPVKQAPPKSEKSYYNDVVKLNRYEFEQLKYWIDLKVIEYEIYNPQGQINAKATDLIKTVNSCINNYNIIIFGESGIGKTLTCLKLFKIFQSSKDKRFPLFIKLSEIINGIENTIKAEIENYSLYKKKLFIFFDGLNEVRDFSKQQKILRQINNYSSLNSDNRIIITTQTIDDSYKILNNFRFFNIQHFEREDVVKYLMNFKYKFNSKEEAENFCGDFSNYIKDFITLPKVLSILVSIYDKEKHYKINSPVELFQEYEYFLCEIRKDRPSMNRDVRKYFIPYLAFNMSKNAQSKINSEQLHKYINEFNQDPYLPTIVNENIKNSLVENHSILRENKNDEYEFFHDLIKDYFAALYMKRKKYGTDSILSIVIAESVENKNLFNSLSFYVGIIEEEIAKELIINIVEKDVFVACRFFVWSSIKTIDEEIINPITELLNKTTSITGRDFIDCYYHFPAIPFYLKVFDLMQKSNRLDTPEHGKYLLDLGWYYDGQFDHENAKKCYISALEIFNKDKKNFAYYCAKSYFRLGKVCKTLGNRNSDESQYNESAQYLEYGIECYEEYNIEDNPLYANIFADYSIISSINPKYGEDNFKEAKHMIKKAISIFEEKGLKNNVKYAVCYFELSLVHKRNSEYDDFFNYSKIALKIFEKYKHNENLDYIYCCISLGDMYRNKSENEKAIGPYIKATNALLKLYSSSNTLYGYCCYLLGLSFSDSSNYLEAINYLEKAIKGLSANEEEQYERIVECHLQLGDIALKKSNPLEAIKQYNNAAPLLERFNEQINHLYTKYLVSMGKTYFKLDEYENSIEYYEKLFSFEESTESSEIIELQEIALLIEFSIFISCLTELALSYVEISERTKAIKCFKKILKFIEKKEHEYIEEYINCLFHLGVIYDKESKSEESLIYFQKCADFIENNQKGIRYLGVCYIKMGFIYYETSEFDMAKEMVEKSIKVFKKNNMKNEEEIAQELLSKILKGGRGNSDCLEITE